MESNDMKITIGLSIFLKEIVESLLYKTVINDKGEKITKTRTMPFRLQYRLNRNLIALNRDFQKFEDQKLYLLAKYGTPTQDETGVTIDSEEKYKKYEAELAAVFNTEVTHDVIKFNPEDIDTVTDNINLSNEAMQIFIGYMTDDPKLYEDVSKNIQFKLPDFSSINLAEKKVEDKPEGKKQTKKVVSKKNNTKNTKNTKN